MTEKGLPFVRSSAMLCNAPKIKIDFRNMYWLVQYFSVLKTGKNGYFKNMVQIQLYQFCTYLANAESNEMRMHIREIVTIVHKKERVRVIKPWFPLRYHNHALFWKDTTIKFPLMDSYKKKELRKDMHFRLDPVLGKADVKYKEERLYLQIKIEIPDTL